MFIHAIRNGTNIMKLPINSKQIQQQKLKSKECFPPKKVFYSFVMRIQYVCYIFNTKGHILSVIFFSTQHIYKCPRWYNDYILEDTARYAGFLLAIAEGFGRGFLCFFSSYFRLFLVLSSNLSNF